MPFALRLAARRVARVRPLAPPAVGLVERAERVGFSGGDSCDRCQVRRNGTRSPASTVNSATVVRSSPCVLTGVRSDSASGPGDSQQRVSQPPYPRHHASVVEADDELHPHRHSAVNALDHPDHVRHDVARRHEVHQAHRPLARLELRLEHQRPLAVPTGGTADLALRRDQPATVALVSEERGEAGRRVEPRHAQPVDGAVAPHQSRGLGVADERVVLDAERHCRILNEAAAAKRNAPSQPSRASFTRSEAPPGWLTCPGQMRSQHHRDRPPRPAGTVLRG